jgi:hypothetical protein
MRLAERGRDALGRLADDLEVPDDGVLGLVIGQEGVVAVADVRLDAGGVFEDVRQIDARSVVTTVGPLAGCAA